MASTFRPVNSSMAIDTNNPERVQPSPTTPTPTTTAFGQLPLPSSIFPQDVRIPESIEENQVSRHESRQQSHGSRGDSEDVDMDDSDGEGHGNEDGAGSEDESVNGDGSKSQRKKKCQRFFCTDYPPCKLSFTRSEHLARHIRKHTGERPFQCHCSRRFSRLDNLRQHAQTVHVNEDIPLDSLAATGTRFQRQIRTERVRQPGRARASTGGSMGAPVRGHSKSLSTSSISSVGSSFSTRDDVRRRPPPLVMADTRFMYGVETYPYRPPSPSDFSTPTSATFSTGQNSPHWGSMASPSSSHTRSHNLYADARTPGRRLSVPSGGIQFHHSPQSGTFRLAVPGGMSGANATPSTANSSVYPSPTSSTFTRRESVSSTEDLRRRTWHPDSSNFNTGIPGSRLSNMVTPSQYPSPPLRQAALPSQQHTPTSPVRLPGIESFISLPHRPASPARRHASSVSMSSEVGRGPEVVHARPIYPPSSPTSTASTASTARTVNPEERRSIGSWDMGLHQGLTRLDITSNPMPQADRSSPWPYEPNSGVDAPADRTRSKAPTVRFNEPVRTESSSMSVRSRAFHQHTMSAPSTATPRDYRRRAWLQNPASAHSEASSGPPSRVDRIVHPNISEFTGFPAKESLQPRSPREESSSDRQDMLRLDALVAVATSEGHTTAAF
ncbi:hypothetical protein GGS20DRAFT_516315 [Poronia punctata]|nr:hypothetical protein GGS20DRAFT_516315 [Poronia punctata]